MAQYDPAIIQKFADKLYTQANTIVVIYTLIGAILGGGLGFAANANMRLSNVGIIAAIICGLIGFALGLQRSFMLRVQAQTALCQMKIEENTRK